MRLLASICAVSGAFLIAQGSFRLYFAILLLYVALWLLLESGAGKVGHDK